MGELLTASLLINPRTAEKIFSFFSSSQGVGREGGEGTFVRRTLCAAHFLFLWIAPRQHVHDLFHGSFSLSPFHPKCVSSRVSICHCVQHGVFLQLNEDIDGSDSGYTEAAEIFDRRHQVTVCCLS